MEDLLNAAICRLPSLCNKKQSNPLENFLSEIITESYRKTAPELICFGAQPNPPKPQQAPKIDLHSLQN